jgi:hypothetical protein
MITSRKMRRFVTTTSPCGVLPRLVLSVTSISPRGLAAPRCRTGCETDLWYKWTAHKDLVS